MTYSCFFVQLNELKNELQPLMQMVKEGKIPAGKVSTLGYISLIVLLSATTGLPFPVIKHTKKHTHKKLRTLLALLQKADKL